MQKMKLFLKNLAIELKKLTSKHIDKVTHMAVTYIVTYTLAHHFDINLAIGVAVLVGVGKEFLDKWLGHNFSIGDIVADIAGIVIAYWMFTL